MLWRARHSGDLWAAVGCAAEFTSLDAAIAALPPEDGLPFASRCAGAVAFDPRQSMEDIWRGFPAQRFWIPQLLLRWTGTGVSGIEIVGDANKANAPELPNDFDDELSTQLVSESTNMERDSWRIAIEKIHGRMRSGNLTKAVLSRRLELRADTTLNHAAAARRISDADNSSYFFALRTPDSKLFCGLSPERLFQKQGDSLFVDSLAGSRPHGSNPDELRASAKDQSEHRIVKDYVRDRLLTLCDNVDVSEPVIREANSVIHLFTKIRGTLNPQTSVGNILHTLHPTPAVCGMPTEAARDLIAQLEPDSRGLYAGAIGMATRDSAEFTVAIRSAILEPDSATLFAGAGIVAASIAENEFDECDWKFANLQTALFNLA
jgi:isochorismate synthase